MSRQTRRAFLKTAAAGAALTLTGASAFAQDSTKKKKKSKPKISDKIIGANERVRVGVAGINGRGGNHISEFASMPGVEVAYLIDPDSNLFKSRTKSVESLGKNTPKCFQDIRKALEEEELNAVSIATCNHWHALITYWACQAGKDVLRREAVQLQRLRGAQVRRGCGEVQADRPARHAGPQQRTDGPGLRRRPKRPIWQAPGLQGMGQQGPMEHRLQTRRGAAQGPRL